MLRSIHPLNIDIDDKFRFWENVTKTETCWLWTKRTCDFKIKGKTINAGRFSWMLHKLQDPESLAVLRSCKNILCVNPDHLYLGDVCEYNTSFIEHKKIRRNKGVRKDSASGFLGVYYDRRDNVFQAQVQRNKRDRISLGRFKTAEEAALVVNEYIIANKMDNPLNVISNEKILEIKTRRETEEAIKRGRMGKFVRQVKPIRNFTTGPEERIQNACFDMFQLRGWLVKRITGNMYQSGLPDCWIAHKKYGQRWVEFKNPDNYCFTPAQLAFFPQMAKAGVGIWILVAATEEEYAKLFQPANWYKFLNILK